MSSKVKSKVYVVLAHEYVNGRHRISGRYLVGAKNEREAEIILREKIGKHRKVNTYYEEKIKKVPYKEIIKEC